MTPRIDSNCTTLGFHRGAPGAVALAASWRDAFAGVGVERVAMLWLLAS